MFPGFWSSKTAPTTAKRKRADESPLPSPALDTRPIINSSFHRPAAAAEHNAEIPDLLLFPDSILKRICMYALQLDAPITVTTQGMHLLSGQAKSELSLFRVCQKLRKFSLPIFYIVNSLDVEVEEFDMQALIGWWRRMAALRSTRVEVVDVADVGGRWDNEPRFFQQASALIPQLEYGEKPPPGQRRLRPYAIPLLRSPAHQSTARLVPNSALRTVIQYTPNWPNLKNWLQLYHSGQLPRTHFGLDNSAELRKVDLAFDHVDAYKTEEWSVAEKGLEAVRGLLGEEWMERERGDGRVETGAVGHGLETTDNEMTSPAPRREQVQEVVEIGDSDDELFQTGQALAHHTPARYSPQTFGRREEQEFAARHDQDDQRQALDELGDFLNTPEGRAEHEALSSPAKDLNGTQYFDAYETTPRVLKRWKERRVGE